MQRDNPITYIPIVEFFCVAFGGSRVLVRVGMINAQKLSSVLPQVSEKIEEFIRRHTEGGGTLQLILTAPDIIDQTTVSGQ